MKKVSLQVNGKKVSKEVADHTVLSVFLREVLNLTGTHVGCDTSQCGACVVHEEFKSKALLDLRKVYPNAAILAHPESPSSVVEVADVVGSTSAIIQGARELDNEEFIVATDRGIFHKLRQLNPDKRFIEAPTAGNGATCRSCAHCPGWQ